MGFPMTDAEYRRYLRSVDFDERIRQPALARCRHRCEACGVVSNRLQAHHDDYFCVRTAEELERVRMLCARCHLRAHGKLAPPRAQATALRRYAHGD